MWLGHERRVQQQGSRLLGLTMAKGLYDSLCSAPCPTPFPSPSLQGGRPQQLSAAPAPGAGSVYMHTRTTAAHSRRGSAQLRPDCSNSLSRVDDPGSWEPARAITRAFFDLKGATARHQVTAVGHCHIDTA